jgi:S-adenosylmethionine decarboxylase proenzyme
MSISADPCVAMQGLHLVADLQGCCCNQSMLCDADRLAREFKAGVFAVGLNVVGAQFYKFSDSPTQPGGVTGVVLLAESHVAVHTWPEFGAVTLDVYVCNYSADNSGRAETLMDSLLELFKPEKACRQRLVRCVPG